MKVKESIIVREKPGVEVAGIGAVSKPGFWVIGIDENGAEFLIGSFTFREIAEESAEKARMHLREGLTVKDMEEAYRVFLDGTANG